MCGNAALCAWCGADAAAPLVTAAESYLRIRALGCPIASSMAVLQAALRGAGDARAPLRAAVYASVANIVLDPIAIFTLGLGLQGAALATVASQVRSVVCVRSRFTRGQAVGCLRRTSLACKVLYRVIRPPCTQGSRYQGAQI